MSPWVEGGREGAPGWRESLGGWRGEPLGGGREGEIYIQYYKL